jgi:hypothetical protein
MAAETGVKMTLTMTDGTVHNVTTAFADILALEEKFDIDASDLAHRQRARWMAFMGWNALHRTNAVSMNFDTFCSQIADLDAQGSSGNE